MNKIKLKICLYLTLVFCFSFSSIYGQRRYFEQVFSTANKISNITYDSNRSVNLLFGSGHPIFNSDKFFTNNLKLDFYEPAGDTESKRPLVILVHGGRYLPAIINNRATGSKTDSSIVELCTRFAKMGYVAVAIDYRSGLNVMSTSQEISSEEYLKANFRAVQDVRAAIRFMRKNAAIYKVDTSKIICGGEGHGGEIVLHLATINSRAEVESNPKFLRSNLTPMVNMDTLGDWKGIGGLPYYNYSADSTVSSNAHMVFTYGGTLFDINWMDGNSLPIVSLHSVLDPFHPYNIGNVIIPETGIIVVPSASGALVNIQKANSLGINSKINSRVYTDEYTKRATAASGGIKNLFPFYNSIFFDFHPWEWWDRAATQATTTTLYRGVSIPVNGRRADSLSMMINPTMSALKARAYIDTIVGFVAPRIAYQVLYKNLSRNLIQDTIIVYKANNATLSVPAGYSNYRWSSNDTTRSINVQSSGKYYVSADSNFYFFTDSVVVIFINGIQQKDTYICDGDSKFISVGSAIPLDKYVWSTSDTTSSIVVKPQSFTKYFCTFKIGSFTFSDTISIGVSNPNKTIVVPKFGLCKADTISVSAMPGYFYAWNKDNSFYSNTATIKVVSSGIYTLTVTDSIGCVATSSSLNFFNAPLPIVVIKASESEQCLKSNNFTFNDSTQLDSGTYTRVWNLGFGSTSSNIKLNHSYTATGNYTVKLVVTTNYGCKDSAYQTVIVNPNPVIGVINGLQNGLAINTPYTYFVNQQANHTYQWFITNGAIASGQSTNSIVAQWQTNGLGTLTSVITNTIGCRDTTNLIVGIGSAPGIVSFTPTSALSGQTVTINGVNFTGTTAVKFGGVNAQSFNVVSANQITAVVSTGATGSVTVETPNGNATLTGFTYLGNTGISESVVKNGVIIYPNPASTILNIEFNKQGNYVVKLTNSIGQTNATTTTTGVIDVSGLANGVYTLSIYDNTNRLISINKVSIIK